jgi:putative tryptophan/tyrosine transport system substrate-binding protein
VSVAIGRRELIAALGTAAAAWPLAARAQQADRMRRVGILSGFAAGDPEFSRRLTAFVQTLQQLGWTEGRDVRIDYRLGAAGLLRTYSAELVALAPDVIVANGDSALGPLQQASRAIPIVFVNVPDPVGAGFVASLARPGGNVTGFTASEYSLSSKWLELLKEIAPHVTRVAFIRDPSMPGSVGQFAAIQAAAVPLGVELSPSLHVFQLGGSS